MHSKNKPLHPSEIVQTYSSNELSGMKITFINMPLRESAMPNTPPEGPGILASIVRNYGAKPYLLDLNAYRLEKGKDPSLPNGRHLSLEETEALIYRHLSQNGDQDIIAFSGMITTLRWQENIAKIVRKLQPNTFLLSGGGLATQLKRGLFKWIPELDAVAHSEGDDVIVVCGRDVKKIKESRGVKDAANSGKLSIYHIGELEGKHRFVYAGNRPKDLDQIPYAALDLLEKDPNGYNVLEQYINVPVWGKAANNSSATSFSMNRSLTSVSSRGCPYACAFCYRGAQGERNYGMRSAEHLAKQVANYVENYNIDFIGFPDDNFAINKKRLKEMPKVFRDYGLNVRWGTHTRLDEADKRVFDMAESGCVYIGFGAESASEPVLRRMMKGGFILTRGLTKKNVNGKTYHFPTTMFDGIKTCKEAGIHANCTWIMGYPGEKLEDVQTSAAFIIWQLEHALEGLSPGTEEYQLAYDSVNQKMFTATAYPGTTMFKDPESKEQLSKNFNLNFNKITGEPEIDDAFHKYVLELDDATKVLHNDRGEPLNFSGMDMDTFLQVREHIDNGKLESILDM